MLKVLIVAILTTGSNGGNSIAIHKFDNEAACLQAEEELKNFKAYYSDTRFQTKCVAQSK